MMNRNDEPATVNREEIAIIIRAKLNKHHEMHYKRTL